MAEIYGTRQDADTYHSERGNAAWAAYDDSQKDVALVRASDYIDQVFRKQLKSGRWESEFQGSKLVPAQFREWPRSDVVDYEGTEIPDGTTPVEIDYATYEAALREAATPGYLLPDFDPVGQQGATVQEPVGPITVKYSDLYAQTRGAGSDNRFAMRPPNLPVIYAVESLVAPYLRTVASSYGTVAVTV